MKTKTFLLVFLFAVISSTLTAQSLQKGNLIGIHTMKVILQPNATMDQYIKFFNEKFAPAFAECRPEWQVYIVRSVRGEVKENTFGIIFIIKSEFDRDKYFNPDGTSNELGKASVLKLKPIEEEMDKIGSVEAVYTDWVVL